MEVKKKEYICPSVEMVFLLGITPMCWGEVSNIHSNPSTPAPRQDKVF